MALTLSAGIVAPLLLLPNCSSCIVRGRSVRVSSHLDKRFGAAAVAERCDSFRQPVSEHSGPSDGRYMEGVIGRFVAQCVKTPHDIMRLSCLLSGRHEAFHRR
ncbi:MAG: hypothetical protein IPO50_15865 [Sphingomonadales bacterium]|nr:hypothetical protein [Sphingomonadales bacterium]